MVKGGGGGGDIRRRNAKSAKGNKSQSAGDDAIDQPTSNTKTRSRRRSRPTATKSTTLWKWTTVKIGGTVAVVAISVGIAKFWSKLSNRSTSSNGSYSQEAGGALSSLMAQDEAWDRTDAKLSSTYKFLNSFVCDHPDGICSPSLQPVPTRRTHRVKDRLLPGEIVLVLPRDLQIWDLDALRDSFVRSELMASRHGVTGNPLDSGAYLAAYLVRRQKLASGQWISQNKVQGEREQILDSTVEDPMKPYFDLLPTYDDLAESHPTLWSQQYLLERLGKYTPAVMLVSAFRDMILSEYRALAVASDEFSSNVTYQQYIAARINVMSRSFGSGLPTKEEELIAPYGRLDEELAFYNEEAGIDLTLGCRAMSPILDMWDSHPRPNAEWTYDAGKRAFVIWAAQGGIPRGHDVIVSYGEYSDSFLFAKFGYVNGDGSSHTEAYINANHRLLDVGLMQQFSYISWSGMSESDGGRDPIKVQNKELLRYLTFDDGYKECIDPSSSSPNQFALKRLKFRMLQAIANQRDRWVMQMSPRNRKQGPGFSSAVPVVNKAPMFDLQKMRFDASMVISTCRLMVLTNDDYEGRSLAVLAEVLANSTADTFVAEKQSEALEYRAASCVFRLVDMMLWRYPSTVPKDMALLSLPPNAFIDDDAWADRPSYRDKEWTTTQVRLGEMQSLEVLGGTMKAHAKRLEEIIMAAKIAEGTSVLTVRHKPCPLKYTLPLLDDDGYERDVSVKAT